SVVAHVSHWRDDVIELSGRRRPRKERKIAERKQPAAESSLETAIPKPGEQVYTLTEAARLWREHEVKTGEVNGNEQNYLMKLGARAEEGRILKTADGKIPESSLDDFLFYMNARRQIYSSKKTGPTKLPVSQAADILRTDAATIEKLVGEGKLIKDGYDKVSIYSIEKFTRRHTYRNGEWVDFTNQKPHNLRQAEKRIKGGRSDYLSAKEAADLYKVSSITILNWARKGEFQTYYDKKPTKFLFSKQDLEKFMKDRSK
ncbi:MAG: helix-turn-helix domain-containing protein, partial [Nanoarchaeota archaeon]|nr:helix-turn-helix domain-containing protein [Nanoarchaeota archaeon]